MDIIVTGTTILFPTCEALFVIKIKLDKLSTFGCASGDRLVELGSSNKAWGPILFVQNVLYHMLLIAKLENVTHANLAEN